MSQKTFSYVPYIYLFNWAINYEIGRRHLSKLFFKANNFRVSCSLDYLKSTLNLTIDFLLFHSFIGTIVVVCFLFTQTKSL